ncbi:MAG: hypothetical protein FWH46_00335 [Methanimicrococcus sp.]|nr:hypothetical protein [Methanimicrococcus sp.]
MVGKRPYKNYRIIYPGPFRIPLTAPVIKQFQIGSNIIKWSEELEEKEESSD